MHANILEAGRILLAADEEGGIGPEERRWDDVIHSAMRELLQRGQEGMDVLSQLLVQSNEEIVLAAASVALTAGVDVEKAKTALQRLCLSTVGNGWPAH